MEIIVALVILFLAIFCGTSHVVSPTKHQMNVVALAFTPAGGSSTPLKGVKSATLAPNPVELSDSADNDYFMTVQGLIGLDWKVMLEFNQQSEFTTLTPGVIGTLVYTLPDFVNGVLVGGGGFTVTVINAVYVPGDYVNAHRTLGTQGPHFSTYSTDGTTSPVSFASL